MQVVGIILAVDSIKILKYYTNLFSLITKRVDTSETTKLLLILACDNITKREEN